MRRYIVWRGLVNWWKKRREEANRPGICLNTGIRPEDIEGAPKDDLAEQSLSMMRDLLAYCEELKRESKPDGEFNILNLVIQILKSNIRILEQMQERQRQGKPGT